MSNLFSNFQENFPDDLDGQFLIREIVVYLVFDYSAFEIYSACYLFDQ